MTGPHCGAPRVPQRLLLLDVLWDLEIGARVLLPEAQALGKPSRLGPARPLRRLSPRPQVERCQLELPRANPFIADNVDLGKTIEAGLVLQELILRQQAGFVLIVCPTSASLQWRDEMMRRSAFASKS